MSGLRHDPAVRYTFETETGELIGRWEPHAPSRDETVTVRPDDDVEHVRDELAAGRLPPPPGIRRNGDTLVFPLPPFEESERIIRPGCVWGELGSPDNCGCHACRAARDA